MNEYKFLGISDADRISVIAQSRCYDSVSAVLFIKPVAVFGQGLSGRADQDLVAVKPHDPAVIMTADHKRSAPFKIMVDKGRIMGQKDLEMVL